MKNKIKDITPKITLYFLYLQPLLDILASFLVNNGVENYITNTIRIIFMIYMIFYLIFANYKHKKYTIIYLLLITINIIIHTTILLHTKDTSVLTYELKNTITVYYYLFILLALINIETNIYKKHITNIFLIYLFLTFIPNILGIGFDSYAYGKSGSAGFFYSANTLGALLVILIPLIITKLKNVNKIYILIISLIILYVLFTLGTKTPVIALIIIIGINLLYLILKLIKEKQKTKLITLIIIITTISIGSIIILPKTTFYQNIETHYKHFKKDGMEIISFKFIDNIIFSERLSLERNTRETYKNSTILEKIFGIGYIENYNTEKETTKIIEIDYLDIFYKEGITGFLLIFIPTIYVIIDYIKNNKTNTFTGINKLTTLILILLLALFQGHIFTQPTISIFIALVLVINSKKEGEINEL